MEQETKKCPYCGEEILAVAKKCKHCGEWLEPKEEVQTTPSADDSFSHALNNTSNNELQSMLAIVKKVKDATGVSITEAKEAVEATGDFYKAMAYIQEKGIVPQEKSKDEDNGPVDVDIPIFAKIAFWIATIGAFVVMVNETGMHGAGRLRGIIEVASWLPSWLGSLLETVGYVGLLSLLMVLAKKLGKPMSVLCGLSIALNILSYIVEVSIGEESLIGLLTMVISLVTIIILGIRLIVGYRNALKELGIAFVAYPLVDIIVGFIVFFYSDAWGLSVASCALSIAFYYIFKDCIISANDEPKAEKHHEILLAGGIGLIIAIVLFFFVTCGSSDSPSCINAEESESYIGGDSVDTITVDVDGINETDIAADSEDYKSFSTDLKNFIQDMQECIDGGLPSTSTIGSHYAEARQGLWRRYNQLVPEMTKEQQEYAYTLLRVIDEMFEKWEEKDKEIFDLE